MKDNNVLKGLKRMLALIETGWTTGTNARDKDRESVNFMSPEAKSFCLMGASNRAACESFPNYMTDYRDERKANALYSDLNGAIRRVINPTAPFSVSLPHWNDKSGRTKAEVVETLKAAIEAATEAQA